MVLLSFPLFLIYLNFLIAASNFIITCINPNIPTITPNIIFLQIIIIPKSATNHLDSPKLLRVFNFRVPIVIPKPFRLPIQRVNSGSEFSITSHLEQTLLTKSDAIKHKIEILDTETKASLISLEQRESTIDNSVALALQKLEAAATAAVAGTSNFDDDIPEIDDSECLLLQLKAYWGRMDSLGFWGFVSSKKNEMELMESEILLALSECVHPARFVIDAMSKVFPMDKRKVCLNDMSWACVDVGEFGSCDGGNLFRERI